MIRSDLLYPAPALKSPALPYSYAISDCLSCKSNFWLLPLNQVSDKKNKNANPQGLLKHDWPACSPGRNQWEPPPSIRKTDPCPPINSTQKALDSSASFQCHSIFMLNQCWGHFEAGIHRIFRWYLIWKASGRSNSVRAHLLVIGLHSTHGVPIELAGEPFAGQTKSDRWPNQASWHLVAGVPIFFLVL